jgi:hypothetical protein
VELEEDTIWDGEIGRFFARGPSFVVSSSIQ